MIQQGNMLEEEWPAKFTTRHLKAQTMDPSRLAKLWRGEIEDEYGKASVLGTAAIALRALGKAHNITDAEAQAEKLWISRDLEYLVFCR